MAIEEVPYLNSHCIRRMRHRLFRKSIHPSWGRFVARPRRQSPVVQRRGMASEAILEGDQSFVIQIGTPEIQFLETLRFCVLNELPEQERSSTKITHALV